MLKFVSLDGFRSQYTNHKSHAILGVLALNSSIRLSAVNSCTRDHGVFTRSVEGVRSGKTHSLQRVEKPKLSWSLGDKNRLVGVFGAHGHLMV